MVTFYHHECSRCGYAFETSGPHEYYLDAKGELADYGHPLAGSLEAKEAGISGFYGRMWCLNKDKNIDVVVREFEHPVGRHDGIWTPGALPEKRVVVTCPACGDDTPVMGERLLGKAFHCPKCGGTIRCVIAGMS